MKVNYILLTLFLLAAAVALCAQPVPQSSLSPASGTLAGWILDPGDARVSAAKVIIEAKKFRREVVSDADGRYSVNLPQGKYKVRVERDGFYPSRKKSISITLNVTTKLDVVLRGIRNDESHP
jgi:hypothetical protein